MAIKIALAGNPNSGKTTLFNALTGSNQFVGNWPGVTVEKKEGKLKGHKDVTIMYLPLRLLQPMAPVFCLFFCFYSFMTASVSCVNVTVADNPSLNLPSELSRLTVAV